MNRDLKPTETCVICTEPFSETHQPVALPCRHIFGHTCIKKWLRNGRGNTNSCPFCRHIIFDQASQSTFDAASIWKALCEQPPERLHSFLSAMWEGIRKLWQRRTGMSGTFTTTQILDEAAIPALVKLSGSGEGPFMDCFNLVAASWDSLGRPDNAQGLAVPLVRLARLMSQASGVLPRWLTSVQRTNLLFWRANAALGLAEENVTWDRVIEAASLENGRYFPLLHLYTVLISQSIAHTSQPRELPTRRHEIMNLVVERCCKRIGADWGGRPSNEFKDKLVAVYQELSRYQVEKGNKSLRGHDGEEHVVRGLWGMAAWSKGNAARRRDSPPAGGTRNRPSSGWDTDE